MTFSIRPGIRLLDGSVADAMEATALTFSIHFIDIYVCSRGPRDDGAEMDGPNSLTKQALRRETHKAKLSSSSSNCCLSDGEQTSALSVEPRTEGQNVECWDYIYGFKYTLSYCNDVYKISVSLAGGFLRILKVWIDIMLIHLCLKISFHQLMGVNCDYINLFWHFKIRSHCVYHSK